MKILYTLIFLCTTVCFPQKQYQFDSLIEYELTIYSDSTNKEEGSSKNLVKKLKKYYLTNSKNNSYLAVLIEKDSYSYIFNFKDNEGITSEIIISKTEFNKAEFINFDCKYVSRYGNPYKYQVNNYDFYQTQDTIIDGKPFYRYNLSSNNPKRAKRKKIGTELYIIDKSTDFHLPILSFSTAYEEWKKERSIPNGIFSNKKLIDYSGKLWSNEQFVNYWKTNKKVTIPAECNYTLGIND